MAEEEPKGPPVLHRAAKFTGEGIGRAAQVTPEAAIAAGLRFDGRVEDASPIRLCYLIAANQVTGRLELAGARGAQVLFFKKGVLEHASSADPQDELGAYLVKRGVVSDEQVAQAKLAADGLGGDLFAALVALRAVDPGRTFPVLQEYGSALACAALATEKGPYTWGPQVAPPASAFPLMARWALVCEAARRFDGLTLRRRLAPRMAMAVARTGGRIALTDLKLTAQEARIAGQFDGGRPLAELAQLAGGEADALLRVALLLAETELAEFVEPRARAAPPPVAPAPSPTVSPPPAPAAKGAPAAAPGAPRSGAPAPAKTPSPAAPKAAPAPAPRPAGAAPAPMAAAPRPAAPSDLTALRAAAKRIAGADHFEVLGVKQDASAPQIKSAYFALAKAWHPDSAAPGESEEAKQLRADLFARLSEAWGVLGDDAERQKYLEALRSGGVGDVDIAAILEAESTFQMATVMVKTRQYPAALAEIEKAIALNGEEPEFHAWRAWVQFLLAPDQKRQMAQSAGEIEAALKKVPRCLPGYLFLGQMAKQVGDPALAEKHLKRGLAFEPNDPDLLRELKYLRK